MLTTRRVAFLTRCLAALLKRCTAAMRATGRIDTQFKAPSRLGDWLGHHLRCTRGSQRAGLEFARTLWEEICADRLCRLGACGAGWTAVPWPMLLVRRWISSKRRLMAHHNQSSPEGWATCQKGICQRRVTAYGSFYVGGQIGWGTAIRCFGTHDFMAMMEGAAQHHGRGRGRGRGAEHLCHDMVCDQQANISRGKQRWASYRRC